MIAINYSGSKYQAPTNWEECTPAQRLSLIMFTRIPADQRSEAIEVEACRRWIGVSEKQWPHWQLARWQWAALRKQFRWVFDTRPTGPPVLSFVHEQIEYVLPEDHFGNSTALDLAAANMHYTAFAHPEEPDPLALDRLIATLCRPARTDLATFRDSDAWTGDVREVYNEHRIGYRAAALARLDLNLKVAVLDYFERMNREFMGAYGEMFGAGTGPRGTEPRYGDGRGWLMMLKNVAKEGHFGDFDKVCHTPATLLWAACLDDLLDARARDDQSTKPTTSHDENY